MHFIRRTGSLAILKSNTRTGSDPTGPERTGPDRNIFFNETGPNRDDHWFELEPDRIKF